MKYIFIISLILTLGFVSCIKINREPQPRPFFDGPTTGMRGGEKDSIK